ncbi:unnamed protein product [Moneuplotes crassus]|uniref:Uncharacterized protein n=1 Tax=Euplotes crassus TaxID=5936 RepID=A0AAD1XNK3_EUPCR|nr:unnamed protein product [Moneuplotes crassus]
MDKKDSILSPILIGSGIAVAALCGVGLYLYLSKNEEEEESRHLSREAILEKLDEELKSIVKPEKISAEQNGAQSGMKIYDQEFSKIVYKTLSKYATMMKHSLNSQSFEQKIEMLRDEDDEGYRKIFFESEKEEISALKKVTDKVLKGIGIMEQDYVFSLNYHSKDAEFKKELMAIQEELTQELFTDDEINPPLPDDLTAEVAQEIKDFAKESTERVLRELPQKFRDANILQNEISFEVAKLDDVIFVKYGYKNKVVLEAFRKYNLLPQQPGAAMNMPS